jgi:hypothetical protein
MIFIVITLFKKRNIMNILKNESVFGTLDLRILLCKLEAIPDSIFRQALTNANPYKYMCNLMYNKESFNEEDWNTFIYFIKCKFDNLV